MKKVVEWIYSESENQKYRFLLGKQGKKMLVCCGVNPSTARPDDLDPTMKRVESLAKNHGYDGYVMINLYPLRETVPENLPEERDQVISDVNMEIIKNLFRSFAGEIHIWAAWGTAVEKRAYLKECLQEIVSLAEVYDCKWYRMGDLTKDGHPRHPLYLSNDCKMELFKMKQLISSLKMELNA